MPRFVILQHETDAGSHYDLMLEVGGVLKTWSLSEPPEADREVACKSLPDHRLAYLDYEGPISGGRGSVTRLGSGHVSEGRTDRDGVGCGTFWGSLGRACHAGTPRARGRRCFDVELLLCAAALALSAPSVVL